MPEVCRPATRTALRIEQRDRERFDRLQAFVGSRCRHEELPFTRVAVRPAERPSASTRNPAPRLAGVAAPVDFLRLEIDADRPLLPPTRRTFTTACPPLAAST